MNHTGHTIINCENIISSHFAYFYVIIEYFEIYFIIKQNEYPNFISEIKINSELIIELEVWLIIRLIPTTIIHNTFYYDHTALFIISIMITYLQSMSYKHEVKSVLSVRFYQLTNRG